MNTAPDPMEQLRGRFRGRLVADRLPLGEALQTGDRDALRFVCHRIAGAAGMFGYPALSARASEVECRVDEGAEADALESVTRQLLREIDEALGSPDARD
jgi:HPt (histidine-containing phosphotransfer) domain-containing protein